MNRRMNLFRQLKAPAPKKRVVPGAPKVGMQLGFHVIVGTTVLGAAIVGSCAVYFGYRQNVAEIHTQIAATEKQMADLVEESQQIAARKPASVARAVSPTTRIVGSALDGTWTSLLWKLTSATDPTIRMNHLTLNTTGAAPTPTPNAPSMGDLKQVVLDGQARSANALRDWLEVLIKTIPGYEFVLESQNQKGEGEFPVDFKVSARII